MEEKLAGVSKVGMGIVQSETVGTHSTLPRDSCRILKPSLNPHFHQNYSG